MKSYKLVVTGAGHVGSYVLANAVRMGMFCEIAVIDTLPGRAHGEALDQLQATGLPSLSAVNVHAGTPDDYRDADIVICSAGPSVIPDPHDPSAEPDRTLLTEANSTVIRQVMGDIAAQTHDAVVILITNPLDTVVYIAENEFGYPAGRVLGTGTMLDSARLRQIVAGWCQVGPSSVQGYMMGEHGHSAFPVLSRLSVAGVRWPELPRYYPSCHALDPEQVRRQVVKSAYDVFNAKGWTNAGVAESAVLLARSVLLDERVVFPVCSTLRGEYGHDGDVALSMPSLIGRGGVEARLPVALDEWENEHLEQTIAAIQATMADAHTGR
ncbi:L-lactate dehydrogenase [Propionibacterium cyclohexanicum]|uniref:L-lactate dehydrogenase n=1 Tax=Propionibacterium cyclohexanicum TaxID=64702 RepID=A0A1H9Q3C4_9ACTN|nr:L-lactate dehydrogenase [Propionibacterium cyclohexanicum]SER54595.1 L-lactate dehydrogenase [Propionibacterium cyclohexanicum]